MKEILDEELKYEEGVYGEIVFASQKRQQEMVKCILQIESKKNSENNIRDELATLVHQAVMETGGVSIDQLEKLLKGKIDKYAYRWDFSANLPEGGVNRGLNHQWSYRKDKEGNAEKALILDAYYKKVELEEKRKEAETAEKNVEKCQTEIRTALTEKENLENEKTKFIENKGALEKSKRLNDKIDSLNKELDEMQKAHEKWPGIEKKIKEAEELQRKQELAKTHDLFMKIEGLQSDCKAKKREQEKLGHVDSDDVKFVDKYQKRQMKLESQIAGLNLVAKIKQTGDVPIEVYSAATGSVLPVTDGKLQIKEAVEIKIPGIMEMQLMPQSINLDAVKKERQKIGECIDKIFEKYGVKSLEELQKKSDEHREIVSKIERLEDKMQIQLNTASITWEELQKSNASVPADIETEEKIKHQMADLYGDESIEQCIGKWRAKKGEYKEKYESIEQLEIAIENQKKQLKQTRDELDTMEDIPGEYQKIEDPEKYKTDLENKLKGIEDNLEKYRRQLSEAEKECGDTSVEAYSEKLAEAEADFENKKTRCRHWDHIYEVFRQSKESAQENPMDDIEENFQKNLAAISDGGVSLSSLNDKMYVTLNSGDYTLKYDILSEGTKDTISLAFRLAMLKHLFPEGGGLAVFDDPFTDMDPQRVEQSCKLIQEYAENNQVIFITCDPKYQEMMSGNVISVSR